MNETLDNSASEKSYPKWLWLVGIAVLVIGTITTYSLLLGRRVQSRLNAIKAAGYPVTGYELNQWDEQVPISENAALKYIEAARLISTNGKQQDLKFPASDEPLGPGVKTNLDQLLSANRKALDLARDAARLKRSRYPVQWQAGPATLLPHLAGVKSVVQLLRVEALVAAEEGNIRLAMQDINGTVKAGESLATEPCTISQLVRFSCLDMAVAELERLLNKKALGPERCEDLLRLFQKTEAGVQKGETRGLIGERCLGAFVFQMSPAQMTSISGDIPSFYYTGSQITGIKKADFLFYLDMMEGSIKASELPFPESLEKLRAVNATTAAAAARHPLYILSKMLLPALEKSAVKTARCVAELRCAEGALAVEQYRLQNGGESPESWQKLVPNYLPGIPIDPFDGKPLRFEWLKPGFLVYSIGEDGKDDGGVESAKPHSNLQEGDLTFKVGR